ncbi:MAG: zinc-ribbon domain-containing protein [Nitrososphaeria archaeon]
MTKYCPKCGAQNPDDAVYCIKCGYRFTEKTVEHRSEQVAPSTALGTAYQPAAQPVTSQVQYCQECGSPVPYGMNYCPVCGSFNIGPNPPARIPRPNGVLVLGILQIVVSAIYIGIGIFIGGLGTVMGPFGLIFAQLGLIFVVIGILSLIFALAFLSGRNWGRILMMIGAVLELLDFPIGTVLGIVILWYLTRPRVKAYFKQPK